MKHKRVVCTVLLAVLFFFPSWQSFGQGKSWTALGTVCSVNVFEDGGDDLYTAIAIRLDEIDSQFSVNRKTSDISRVNAAAGRERVTVSKEVFTVLQTALDFAQKSGGAFDPSIGPVVTLWGICTDHPRVPSQHEIDAALSLVDWRKVSLDVSDSSVFLEKEGMALDLGGIAKGYAADELVKLLKERKVKRAIIDLGGNVYLWGNKANGKAWSVGIRNPDKNGKSVAVVLTLKGGQSVVTSGAYERYFVAGNKKYHHIIDPRTGFPCELTVDSASIVASSSMEADALSTCAFLMGKDAFVRAFPKVSYLLILPTGKVVASKGLVWKRP